MRSDLPSGTVTFLFTDIEGSTKLLHELGADAYSAALAEHRRVLRDAFAANGGVEVDTQGDAFFVAFPTTAGALAAAASATEALRPGRIHVRMGIHTGRPLVTAEGYVGPDVHRAARIAAAGHGGQVLVSRETRDLLEGNNGGVVGDVVDDYLDLGEHRLKDIAAPVWIFQLGSEHFPPLATISNTNLPRPAGDFVGRESEVGEVVDLLRDGVRLLTLTGPGGSGKTRLAIEAATRLVPAFKSGVFWVALAPVRDPELVMETIGQTLGSRNGVAEHIGERDLLLLVDNVEHVVAAAPRLSELMESCPNLRVMTTSRELMRVRGEREFPVLPLAEDEAVALFSNLAGVEPDATVRELCRALDDLPLALELAASRASVLSPKQILERLSGRLDLLKGGRDADPRQQTLRATIEWSHDLLSPAERQLFARMSVFAGGCTLEAAEAVTEADLDALQSLVDKSLLRHVEERFSMLESIHAYAAERLDASGATDELRRHHADYYLHRALELEAVIESGEPEEEPVSLLEAEIHNFRAAIEHSLASGEVDLVREITAALPMYWMVRGLYPEARSWLERALAIDDAQDDTRRRLLSALANIAYAQGDHLAAVGAADAAASLAAELGGATEEISSLRVRAFAALVKGDLETAEALYRERLGVAIAVGNGVATSACRLQLVYIANKTGRHEQAEALLAENLLFVRARGQVRCEANTLASFAETRLYQGRDGAGDAVMAAGLALQIQDNPLTVDSLELFAASAASAGDLSRAATILAATEAVREQTGLEPDEDEAAIRTRALDSLGDQRDAFAGAWETGRGLDLAGALEVAEAHTERTVSPEPRDVTALLDRIDGAWERAQLGLEEDRRGEGIGLTPTAEGRPEG